MYKLAVIIPVYNQEDLILRALYSIPNKREIKIIIVNDGSTDGTEEKINQFIKDKSILCDITFFNLEENRGVSYAINKGLTENVDCEYTVLLGSDDYFLPEINDVIEQANGEDLVYFNLRINDGTFFDIVEENRSGYCGSVKLMRSTFIQGLMNDTTKKYGEDYFFFQEVLKRKPTEKFTRIVAKHYNYPREGSLSWRQRNHLD